MKNLIMFLMFLLVVAFTGCQTTKTTFNTINVVDELKGDYVEISKDVIPQDIIQKNIIRFLYTYYTYFTINYNNNNMIIIGNNISDVNILNKNSAIISSVSISIDTNENKIRVNYHNINCTFNKTTNYDLGRTVESLSDDNFTKLCIKMGTEYMTNFKLDLITFIDKYK